MDATYPRAFPEPTGAPAPLAKLTPGPGPAVGTTVRRVVLQRAAARGQVGVPGGTSPAVPGERAAAARPRPISAPPARPVQSAPAPRLEWLDALRGLAALVVAYFHVSQYTLGATQFWWAGWLDLGKYGVLLFFMVSGYVIPMSLERHGSLRRFWIGRIFRLYPAWLLATAGAGVLIAVGFGPLPAWLRREPGVSVVAQVTMLQDLLGVPNLLGVVWTLSYEMTFYLLVSALFVMRLHRRTANWAMLLAGGAFLGAGALPPKWLALHHDARTVVVMVTAGLLVAAIAAYVAGRRRAALAAAVASLSILALPAVNGAASRSSMALGSWQGLIFLAVMFAGTVVYRAQHGQITRARAASALATVFGVAAAVGWHRLPDRPWPPALPGSIRAGWLGALVMVALTFAAGYALRHRRMPRVAIWLGEISYSVYLLHLLGMYAMRHLLPGVNHRPAWLQCVVAAAYFAAVLAAAELAYRLVELPGQALGKRASHWLDGRLGPDTGTAVPVGRRGPLRARGPIEPRRAVRVAEPVTVP